MKDELMKATKGTQTTEGEEAEDFGRNSGEGRNKRANFRYFLLGVFRVD